MACFHCRANAQEVGGGEELSTDEGFALIDTPAAIGSPRPILILTGGDCLMREDLVRIATYAALAKVPIAIAPSVTPRLTPATLPESHDLLAMSQQESNNGAARTIGIE